MSYLSFFCKSESGATAIEYALIVALLSIVAITAMNGVGTSIGTTFNTAASGINSR